MRIPGIEKRGGAGMIQSLFTAAPVTEQSAQDVLESAGDVAVEATQEVNQFVKFFQENIPGLVAFGIKVLLALVFFFIGRAVIRGIRKFVKHSMQRANADTGVMQFVDSLLKFGLYALLIFSIATKFG